MKAAGSSGLFARLTSLAISADPKLDSTVFVFAFLLSIVTAFIFGVMPSLRASKTDLVNNLKEDSHLSAPSAGSARFAKSSSRRSGCAFAGISRRCFSLFPRRSTCLYTSIPASTRITSLSS